MQTPKEWGLAKGLHVKPNLLILHIPWDMSRINYWVYVHPYI